MKKFIAAFDGLKYSKATRDYATYLAKQASTHLVGVFLDDAIYTSYKIYDLVAQEGTSYETLKEHETKDRETRIAAAKDFEENCQQKGLEYTVHHDRKIALQELKHESIYADLLIIDSKETLTHYPEKIPTRFIRDLLTDVQCPALVVPRKYRNLQKIILLYDGGPSSVHAIKMFSYLLPMLKHLPTEVVTVNSVDETAHMPDNKLMREFMKRHFPTATYKVLKGVADAEIIKYVQHEEENALIVLGAYRRGTVNMWFRQSMADSLMQEVKMPLFIAHNK